MSAEEYDQWYETRRGQWIGAVESAMILDGLRVCPGESLLDVGCGTGYFTRRIGAATEGEVTGVDINREWLDYARHRDTGGATYTLADARALPYEDASFDLVMSIAATCFIEDELAAIREIVRVARRRVAIGLLNRHSILWWKKGRNGGSGAYRGAQWHSVKEVRSLFDGLPVKGLGIRTGVHFPGGSMLARSMERVVPSALPTGAFILVTADVSRSVMYQH
ncbi:MAG: class I SAM-dependent methyltransferase [Pseudomonadota bacterium]